MGYRAQGIGLVQLWDHRAQGFVGFRVIVGYGDSRIQDFMVKGLRLRPRIRRFRD